MSQGVLVEYNGMVIGTATIEQFEAIATKVGNGEERQEAPHPEKPSTETTDE